MKWINIPEGAESVGSACTRDGACVCLCACGQAALGDQSAQLLAASSGASPLHLLHIHTAVLCMNTSSFDQHLSAAKI